MSSKGVYIGELKSRISIFEMQRTKTPTGQTDESEVLVKRCWSKVDDVQVTEDESGKVMMMDVRKYVVRYDAELLGSKAIGKFIKDRDELFDVQGVQLIGHKRYIQLKCVRRE